jgi:hypothetical protein
MLFCGSISNEVFVIIKSVKISMNKYEGIYKEAVVAHLKYSNILLEELRKTVRNFSQGSWQAVRNLNPDSTRYRSSAVPP